MDCCEIALAALAAHNLKPSHTLTPPLCWTIQNLELIQVMAAKGAMKFLIGNCSMTSASPIHHQSAAGKLHMRLELWSEETRFRIIGQRYIGNPK
jgi:hypothetical protein